MVDTDDTRWNMDDRQIQGYVISKGELKMPVSTDVSVIIVKEIQRFFFVTIVLSPIFDGKNGSHFSLRKMSKNNFKPKKSISAKKSHGILKSVVSF